MIEITQKKYKRTGRGLSGYKMQAYLPKLKKQYPWLKEVNAQSLQITCCNVANAYKRFFNQSSAFPNFKKKSESGNFACIDDAYFKAGRIRLPKLGLIRYRGGFLPEGRATKFIISKYANKYYVTVLLELNEKELELKQPYNILGLDVGLNSFIVASNGFEIPVAKYTHKYQAALRQKQKALSRCKKGSNRRNKARLEVARLHQKIGNKRKDHAHKLSRILIDGENQAFAIENLNIKGMMKNRKLAKSIADAGWYQFLTFLKYKSAAVGKPVLEVGRFFPSSKTCSACGIVKESLALSEREWVCGSCGAKHNRDVNAAINIALEAARNAVRGDGVIPFVRRVAA